MTAPTSASANFRPSDNPKKKGVPTSGADLPLTGHLAEVRKRLTRAAVAFVIAAVVAYCFSDRVLDVLRDPILHIADTSNAAINYDSITGAFDLKLKIALYGGIVLSSPVWMYQVLAFITPALTSKEKRYTFGFLAGVVPLFAAGCTAGILVFPRMVELLTGFAAPEDSTFLQASYYFDFVLKLVLAAGLAFTLPVLIVVLNVAGVLPARTIARGWRVCVLTIVLFSALVTPAADLMSMFLLAIPMTTLFVLAWAIAWLHDRRTEKGEPPCSG